MWQDYALGGAGALILILIGIIGYSARKRDSDIDDMESKLEGLDRAFALKIEWFSGLEKKLDTYFKKMDDAITKLNKIDIEYANISGAAELVKHALTEFQTIVDNVKAEAVDVMRETKQLTVTNKKRQVILEKQVSKICDKLGIKFEYDPDLFIDYDVFRKFKDG